MFITLRFGDDDKFLVNPNCAAKNILEFIREKCNCDKNAQVDLCDETGQVKYLYEQEMELATEILENKAIYIPLVVERNEDHAVKKFVPLLNSCNKIYPGIKKKLKAQCPSFEPGKSPQFKFDASHTPAKSKTKSVMELKQSKSRGGSTKKRA